MVRYLILAYEKVCLGLYAIIQLSHEEVVVDYQ